MPLARKTSHLGLIPAHAGKTSTGQDLVLASRAHPRSRGENSTCGVSTAIQPGSSPLTRGKQSRSYSARRAIGLIPAHAGKTFFEPVRAGLARAHPRSRGENPKTRSNSLLGHGSSPLTRGKLLQCLPEGKQQGLIPAHAGKTDACGCRRTHPRAHPRSRGENHAAEADPKRTKGSSPLTRGKHFLTCAFIAQIGQILESLELCASSESYSLRDAYATDALQDQVRSIGLVPLSSRGAS